MEDSPKNTSVERINKARSGAEVGALEKDARLIKLAGMYSRHLQRLSALNNRLFFMAVIFTVMGAILRVLAGSGVTSSTVGSIGTMLQAASGGLLLATFLFLLALKSPSDEDSGADA